ncbi:tRNA pseudouridine(38/39) synthase, partial [Frankliniella fusca]
MDRDDRAGRQKRSRAKKRFLSSRDDDSDDDSYQYLTNSDAPASTDDDPPMEMILQDLQSSVMDTVDIGTSPQHLSVRGFENSPDVNHLMNVPPLDISGTQLPGRSEETPSSTADLDSKKSGIAFTPEVPLASPSDFECDNFLWQFIESSTVGEACEEISFECGSECENENEDEHENFADALDDFPDCELSDEDDEEFQEFQTENSAPEYSDSHNDLMLAILAFVLIHQLSKRCVTDLLGLLRLFLPQNFKLVNSAYSFFKYFDIHRKTSHKKFFFCSFCRGPLTSIDERCAKCGPGKRVNYFFQVSVVDQLKQMLLRPGFFDNLSYPRTRTKMNNNSYEDVYDGEIYKAAVRDHMSDNYTWLTFMWNSDGFSLFKSSTFQVWPIYLTVNELPPYLRFRRENMLLAGLWFGLEKPDINLFLKPIHEEFLLLRNGIQYYVHSHGLKDFKGAILCGTCDAPATALFRRHKYFNGKYGCPRCLSRREKSQRTGNVFVYPYEENLELRTDARHLAHLRGVRRTGRVQFGVKGPSCLQLMLLVSFIRSSAIDIMNNIFSGLLKAQLTFWFSKQHRGREFSLFHLEKSVSDVLMSIKPPHFFQRVPQAISKLAFWKASEFQTFFFYYSLPVLYPFLDQVYFNHFKQLYLGITLLCSQSVSEADLTLSQTLLDDFVRRFEIMYGLRHMTFNLHVIRHLPDVVRDLGPLFTSTCFILVHGSQYVGLQIVSTFELLTKLPVLINDLPPGNVRNYCGQLRTPFSRFAVSERLGNVAAIGKFKKNIDLPILLRQAVDSLRGNVLFFTKLLTP